MTDEHLPTKERAKHPGNCYECGLMIYVGDWIMVYNVGDIPSQPLGNTVAAHAEHYGVTDK